MTTLSEYPAVSSLKDLREARGVTQTELASRLAMDQSALSRLEGRPGTSITMLNSVIEALGGKLHMAAAFSDEAYALVGFTEPQTLDALQRLRQHKCRVHPMPPERAADEFLVREVTGALVELEKLSNQQLVELPVRRIVEVLPATSTIPATVVLRGRLDWSANELLWKLALD